MNNQRHEWLKELKWHEAAHLIVINQKASITESWGARTVLPRVEEPGTGPFGQSEGREIGIFLAIEDPSFEPYEGHRATYS